MHVMQFDIIYSISIMQKNY